MGHLLLRVEDVLTLATEVRLLSAMAHAACLFVSSDVLHQAPLIRPAEPLSVHVFGRVLLNHQPASLLVPQRKGSQAHLEQLFLYFIKPSL